MIRRASRLRRWRTRSAGDRRLTPPYDPPNRDDPHAADARRALRMLFRKLTQVFLLAHDAEPEMSHRASGDCLCTVCGQCYGDHAEHPVARFLTVLCDGRNVKL